MYCSDKQFISIATKTGVAPADLYEMIQVIAGLQSTWGSLIKSKTFKVEVEKEFAEIVKMIELLETVDKVDASSLKRLLILIQHDNTQSFTIIGSTHELLEKKLRASFGEIEIEHETSQEPSLQVA
jgi:hypothetical protein